MVGQKRFLSGGVFLAYALISKDIQSQLVQWTPSPLNSWFYDFKLVAGETFLTSWGWPVGLCIGYFLSVLALRQYMLNKQPWDLYALRVVHNAFLCFASFLMLAGCIKETFTIFQQTGMEGLLCDSKRVSITTNANLWYYLFYLSKFYEFIDTWILILRRKPLTFLHVFHHFITAYLCWAAMIGELPNQWLTLILNTGVHVAMYYYYLTQTLGGDVWWKKYLTSAQIVQFILDIGVIQTFWYYKYGLGLNCAGDERVVLFADAVLLSFLALFLNFFLKTYTPKKQRVD